MQAVSGERMQKRSKRRKKHPWLRRIAGVLLFLFIALLLSIILFRFVNPPITPVMLAEKARGGTLREVWIPLEDMSRQLPLAAISGEDGRFCLHWGVDWGAVREAIHEGGDHFIVVGRVIALYRHEPTPPPLVFHSGRYTSLAETVV